MSRIGKKTITLPKGVSVTIQEQALEVKGPKGNLKTPIPAGISFKLEGEELRAERTRTIWRRCMAWPARWRTTRSWV